VPKPGPPAVAKSHPAAEKKSHPAAEKTHPAGVPNEHASPRAQAEHASVGAELQSLAQLAHQDTHSTVQHETAAPGRSIATHARHHGRPDVRASHGHTTHKGGGHKTRPSGHASREPKRNQPVSTQPQPSATTRTGHITLPRFHAKEPAPYRRSAHHAHKTKTEGVPPPKVPTAADDQSASGRVVPLPLSFSLGLIPVGIAGLVALFGTGLLVLTRRRELSNPAQSRQPKHIASKDGSSRR
jgi:hypothetical protein